MVSTDILLITLFSSKHLHFKMKTKIKQDLLIKFFTLSKLKQLARECKDASKPTHDFKLLLTDSVRFRWHLPKNNKHKGFRLLPILKTTNTNYFNGYHLKKINAYDFNGYPS
jgi:hypothetical protein